MTTPRGSFTIELFEGDAPLHSENFQQLVREGRWKGWTFHKVLENYMALAGDPDASQGADEAAGRGVAARPAPAVRSPPKGGEST